MSHRLSICIPCLNQWNFTKACLNDLNHLPDDVEIILFDNGSSDETQEAIKAYPRVKYIRNETNGGFAVAVNGGYAASDGDYVLFLNNDIRVRKNHNNWVDELLAECTDNNLVGPTGGKVDPKNDFGFLYETNDPSKDINYVSGWCIVAKRSVWEKIIENNKPYKGPFSEQYFCYFEDTHMGFLANKMGINFKLKDIPVVHFGKTTTKKLNISKFYSESRVKFIKNWKQR